MSKRDFLALSDLTTPELEAVLALAVAMKRAESSSRPLSGRSIAMIFGKSSTRTRVSFEVAISQLGGNPLYLSSGELQLGRGELVRDTRVTITELPEEALSGAQVVTTDVWISMGHEGESDSRAQAFQGYAVDEKLMSLADPAAIFLRCLPAHRGEEVTEGVLEGPQSRVWDEAENRLHVQKALLATLIS